MAPRAIKVAPKRSRGLGARRQEVKTMMRLKHWQDAVNAVLGVWLVLSPWAVGFQGETLAMSNAVIVGIALVAAALGAIFVPRAWEEWTECALGVWMLVSPWVLGFMGNARIAAVGTGVVIVVLALWTLATDPDYRAQWRDRPMP
jgi:hypothetical protein